MNPHLQLLRVSAGRVWLCIGVLLAGVTGSCGGEAPDDCRSSARSCFAPARCVQGIDRWGCSLGAAQPSCKGSPAGQTIRFSTAENGATLHWVLMQERCIRVTYDPELAAWAGELRAAAVAWTAIACSRLCFDPPEPSTTPVDPARAERRVHLAFAGSSSARSQEPLSSETFAVPIAYYDGGMQGGAIGRILAGEIIVNRTPPFPIEPSDWVAFLGGGVLGLEPPWRDADSILTEPRHGPQGVKTIRPADEEAFCTLYGDPS